jgi:hypothetical protein
VCWLFGCGHVRLSVCVCLSVCLCVSLYVCQFVNIPPCPMSLSSQKSRCYGLSVLRNERTTPWHTAQSTDKDAGAAQRNIALLNHQIEELKNELKVGLLWFPLLILLFFRLGIYLLLSQG